MSAIQVFHLYINHSEFSWYIKQCPLLGRGPLLGASVNGELTVQVFHVIKWQGNNTNNWPYPVLNFIH